MNPRPCDTCGTSFRPRRSSRRYCSRRCAGLAPRKRPANFGQHRPGLIPWNKGKPGPRGPDAYNWKGGGSERADVVCKRCGRTFTAKRKSSFCSRRCFTPRTCIGCGVIFKPSYLARKFCSQKCHYASTRGEKNPGWRGGKRNHERGTYAYRRWRKAVFERDRGLCVKCGSPDDIEADHIRPWASYPDLRYVVANGRLLCGKCHHRRGNHGRPIRQLIIPLDWGKLAG